MEIVNKSLHRAANIRECRALPLTNGSSATISPDYPTSIKTSMFIHSEHTKAQSSWK